MVEWWGGRGQATGSCTVWRQLRSHPGFTASADATVLASSMGRQIAANMSRRGSMVRVKSAAKHMGRRRGLGSVSEQTVECLQRGVPSGGGRPKCLLFTAAHPCLSSSPLLFERLPDAKRAVETGRGSGTGHGAEVWD